MADAKLIKYFKDSLAKGYSLDKLIKALIKEGWDPTKVEEAAKQFKGPQNASKTTSSASKTETGEKQKGKDSSKKDSKTKEKIKKGKKEGAENPEGKKPVGVIIVSILHWIIAASIVASAAIQVFFRQDFLLGVLLSAVPPKWSVYVIGAFVLLALLPFFAGLGILNGKSAWRVIAIIFGIIGMIGGLFSFMNPSIAGAVGLALSGYIALYLIISKEAKAHFKDD